MSDYEQPKMNKDAFHCPHCGSYSDQYWLELYQNLHGRHAEKPGFHVGSCRRCSEVTIWNYGKMIFPSSGDVPMPNLDMPESIKENYLEARDVVTRSPRSACVLLRLCVEEICNEKVPGGGDLNEKIGKMVQQGLDGRIKKAMDSVRVIGGQAVHPLTMNLKDDTGTATALFSLVNYISDWAYTSGKRINGVFGMLPDSKKDAISKRDGKT